MKNKISKKITCQQEKDGTGKAKSATKSKRESDDFVKIVCVFFIRYFSMDRSIFSVFILRYWRCAQFPERRKDHKNLSLDTDF